MASLLNIVKNINGGEHRLKHQPAIAVRTGVLVLMINYSGIFTYVALAVVFLGACAGFWSQRKRKTESDLRAPLLLNDASSSADARVETAIRAAQQGFHTCVKCSFENLMASSYCAICGAAFTSTTATGLSTRQQRVRQRRQWIRGVDDTGKVFWNNTGAYTSAESAGSGLKSWVLRLQAPRVEAECHGEDTTEPQDATSEAKATTDTEAARDEVVVDIQEVSETSESRPASKPEIAPTIAAVAKAVHHAVTEFVATLQDAEEADAAVASVVIMEENDAVDPSSTLQRAQEVRDAVTQSQLDFPTKLAQFITASSSLFLNATNKPDGTTLSTRFLINRDMLLSDSIEAFATMTPTEALAAIRVNFTEDKGVDAGGVYREWFLLLNEAIVMPEAGIFTCVDQHDQTFYLNPHSRAVLGDDHLVHFLAAGRLLGRSLLEGNVTGFHLAQPLLKIILGQPVGLADLQYFDPEVYNNLKWLLANDGVDALCLDFTVTEKLPDGSTRTVEFVEGGAEIEVTDANKAEFVDAKLKYLVFESVSEQLFALLTGLYEVIPAELLMLFDAVELDYVLSGSDEIDVDDWERHTKYTPDLIDHPARKHFWELVREMTLEERQLLLQFATGSSRVPPAGFAALSSYDGRLSPFTLYSVGGWQDGGYVRSHACFNRIDLPRHHTKKGLKIALSAALFSDDKGFTIQ